MIKKKQEQALYFGTASIILGILLRIFARDIAWPKEYGYSGLRENTLWAIRERAYQDIGMSFLIFGLAVIIIVLINWLWMTSSIQEEKS